MPDFSEVLRNAWALDLGFANAALRLVAALVCGAIIGIERERRHRPAGLRTHMLVALASALFTIIAFQIYADVQVPGQRTIADPLRLLEAITAGVAFVAAGAFFRRGEGVTGLSSGGGLWLSGALGMACGRGFYGLAFLGAILALVVLTRARALERRDSP